VPKILLIEDNEDNRDSLSRRLQRRGFAVAFAVDGKQGVLMAGSERPDLILMDMNLPELDGWEATRQIKSAPETRTIPVIALTAHAMSGDRERALEVGCADYHTKPVEFARLLTQIEALLTSGTAEPTAPLSGEEAPAAAAASAGLGLTSPADTVAGNKTE
jgi:CheY-like chemotaxis protein